MKKCNISGGKKTNKFCDIGLEVAWGKKYVQEWKICSDVLLTLAHGNTDNMIATRIAQLRLSQFCTSPGWLCMSTWPAVCKSESQHGECANAYHQVVLQLQDSHPLGQQQCHHPDKTGYTGATCLRRACNILVFVSVTGQMMHGTWNSLLQLIFCRSKFIKWIITVT